MEFVYTQDAYREPISYDTAAQLLRGGTRVFVLEEGWANPYCTVEPAGHLFTVSRSSWVNAYPVQFAQSAKDALEIAQQILAAICSEPTVKPCPYRHREGPCWFRAELIPGNCGPCLVSDPTACSIYKVATEGVKG